MINYKNIGLSKYEEDEIDKLLKIRSLKIDPLVEMWDLIDYVWDFYECNSNDLKNENIGKFYSHPVWLLNGLFIENHDESMNYRKKIVNYLLVKQADEILDYGGGFGTLAREIAKEIKSAKIDVYEPYPSQFGLKRMKEFKNINVINKINKKYNFMVQTDVLEHVENPLQTLYEMIVNIKVGGKLIIGNCFSPCIKCHLPQHYHFNNTFVFFAKMLGLKKIDQINYIYIFEKTEEKEFNLKKFDKYIFFSKQYYKLKKVLKKIRNMNRG